MFEQDKFIPDSSSYQETWGTFWQGDFTPFTREGIYQIETEYGFTTPFVIEGNPYNRLIRSYCELSILSAVGDRDTRNTADRKCGRRSP